MEEVEDTTDYEIDYVLGQCTHCHWSGQKTKYSGENETEIIEELQKAHDTANNGCCHLITCF